MANFENNKILRTPTIQGRQKKIGHRGATISSFICTFFLIKTANSCSSIYGQLHNRIFCYVEAIGLQAPKLAIQLPRFAVLWSYGQLQPLAVWIQEKGVIEVLQMAALQQLFFDCRIFMDVVSQCRESCLLVPLSHCCLVSAQDPGAHCGDSQHRSAQSALRLFLVGCLTLPQGCFVWSLAGGFLSRNTLAQCWSWGDRRLFWADRGRRGLLGGGLLGGTRRTTLLTIMTRRATLLTIMTRRATLSTRRIFIHLKFSPCLVPQH